MSSTPLTSASASRLRLTANCMSRAASGASTSSTKPTMARIGLRAAAAVALSVTRRGAAPPHEPEPEVRHQRDHADQRHRERRDEDVVVLHVAQLVGEHALELDPVHLLEQPGGDRDRGVLGVAAGGERVRRRVVDDVDARLRQAGRRCTGPRRGCAAAAYSTGSAGLAWLIASATASDFQYAPERRDDGDDERDDEAGHAVAEQQVDAHADRSTTTSTKAAMSSAERRLFAAICSYSEKFPADFRTATVDRTAARCRRPRSTRGSVKPNMPARMLVGKRLDLRVQLQDGVVVELAGVGDPALGAGELLLQRQEVLVRLEVRIGLGHGEQRLQRAGDHVLGLGLLGGALGVHGHVSGPG